MAYAVAESLADWYNIPLQNVTYRDYKGKIQYGNEQGKMLYQDLFKDEYNLKDQAFLK